MARNHTGTPNLDNLITRSSGISQYPKPNLPVAKTSRNGESDKPMKAKAGLLPSGLDGYGETGCIT